MKISLNDIGKKFQRHWIFQNITYNFESPKSYAILGSNGSGKSTLLRLIAGIHNPSNGAISYAFDNQTFLREQLFPHLAYAAPGMEIIEELTLTEFFDFHFSFKKPQGGLTSKEIISIIGLHHSAHKPIADFSSGMKQRVKLAQAIFADTPLLLLDEPCSNLDEAGVQQYADWIKTKTKGRLVIVASNDEREYSFCNETIHLNQFKNLRQSEKIQAQNISHVH